MNVYEALEWINRVLAYGLMSPRDRARGQEAQKLLTKVIGEWEQLKKEAARGKIKRSKHSD